MIDFARIPDNVWQHVYPCPNTGCWLWGGHAEDYGRVSRRNPVHGETRAHRVVKACIDGPLNKELVLDHLCANKLCVNPEHLEEVTHSENSFRGDHGNEWGNTAMSAYLLQQAYKKLNEAFS